ncbi:MAG: transcriptional regulator [Thermoprotei archaeon]|nr:MAG: transcriptional regulator [Thermoprotei archaeon]RLE90058.1 MAG: transcriptional regulator [Thermoprotei archaeon]
MSIPSPPRAWREQKYRYRLVGVKCTRCGLTYYPPVVVCTKCKSTELTTIELPRKGVLLSYTIIHYPPVEFKEYAPYAVGLIKLEDGTEVIAQLTDIDFNELRPGIKVEAVFRCLKTQGEEGIIEYGMKFRRALEE